MSTLQVYNIIAPNSNTGTTNIVLGVNGDVTFANTFSFSPNGQFVYSNTATPMTVGTLNVTSSAVANTLTVSNILNVNATSTFNSLVNFAGNTSVLSVNLRNSAEIVTVNATPAIGTINFDLTTQSVLYYSANSTGNTTINFRGNGSNSLNNLLANGQAITGVFLQTNGITPFYNSNIQIDGTFVTPKWVNGSAPTGGNSNSIDSYTYTIIKTGSAAFSVLANQTKYS